MPKNPDLEKTWNALSSRPKSDTFNTSGNFTIPYGRYRAVVTGRGGTGIPGNVATYNSNYNVAYPIGNRPIANQPIATYNIAYPVSGSNPPGPPGFWLVQIEYLKCSVKNIQQATNFNFFYNCPSPYGGSQILPYDNLLCQLFASGGSIQSAQRFSVQCQGTAGPAGTPNYNVAYPGATYNTNYNTNYNIAYPIANQPIGTYNAGNPGPATNVLGVNFPGGGVSGGIGQLAPTVGPTVVSYWSFPDSSTQPVTVPQGGTINISIE